MPSSFLPVYDDPSGQQILYVTGPMFYLLDEFGNVVVLWGADDTDPWHRDPAGDVYVADPGAWGAPPWAAVVYDPAAEPWIYRTRQFVTPPFTPPPPAAFLGLQPWQVCVDPGDPQTPVCSTFSVDNSQHLSWIATQWPFLADDVNTDPGGVLFDHYMEGDEWLNPASWRTSPGQPLLFQPSGTPLLLRIDPTTSDQMIYDHVLPEPHTTKFADVPVRVWLSGPNDRANVIRWTREDPDAPWQPEKVEDVELCVGEFHYDAEAEYPMAATCDQIFQGEAFLNAYTCPFLEPEATLDGTPWGAAFGITKAPSEPGWYTIIVETDDPRFAEYSQLTKDWNVWGRWMYGFEVMGGVLLDEQYFVISDPIVVPRKPSWIASGGLKTLADDQQQWERTITVEAPLPTTEPTVMVVARLLDFNDNFHSEKDIQLSRIGVELDGDGRYQGVLKLTSDPDAQLADNEMLVDDNLYVVVYYTFDPVARGLIALPTVEFMDDAPTYSAVTDPGSDEYDPGLRDCDNYFLRENQDHQNLDIYYRILPSWVPVEDVQLSIFAEFIPDEEPTVFDQLPGESDAEGGFKSGDELHVIWQGADDGASEPREVGFYRVQLAVKFAGIDGPIQTPIYDGDDEALGWQCPQEGLAIQDLIWKHRPLIYAHVQETGTPVNLDEFIFEACNSTATQWWVPIEGKYHSWPSVPTDSEYVFWDVFLDENVSGGSLDVMTSVQRETYESDPIDHSVFSSSQRDASEEAMFLQYWMFENYSTPPIVEALDFIRLTGFPYVHHEGDLEYVQIALRSGAEKNTWFEPFAATASQHYYAQSLPWDTATGVLGTDQAHLQTRVQHVNNGRLVVYLALGSHATYFVPDTEICSYDELVGTDVMYRPDCLFYSVEIFGVSVGAARVFDTTSPCSVDPIAYELIPLSTEVFFNTFEGHWGYRDGLVSDDTTNGPPGPPRRAAKSPLGAIVLRDMPCSLHNLASRPEYNLAVSCNPGR